VIGIDSDLSKGATEFLIPHFRSHVQMHELTLFDLRPQTFGRFDVIVLAGVLYHLRYPFWGLKILRDLLSPDGILIIETAILMDDNRHAMQRRMVTTLVTLRRLSGEAEMLGKR
jgi:2-polyprenyl-3-methyl-5-hydroxy-6-metoxy-1,4-benzoquinol methylase